MVKKIRDPIHGYIYLSDVEARAAADPLVLRLHNIHQNSFTYLTYPSTHNTRYPHSLGVLHVAGLMLNHGLINSSPPALTSLVAEIRTIVPQLPGVECIIQGIDKNANALESFLDEVPLDKLHEADSFYRSLYATTGMPAKEALLLKALAQGVRLAALLHDTGHPPYSHIVEYALQNSIPGYKDHESISTEIAQCVFRNCVEQLETAYYTDNGCKTAHQRFTQLSFLFALGILDKRVAPGLTGLRDSLFSGEVDPDRLDYVTRDINAAGISTLTYDLGRILDACEIGRVCPGKPFELRLTTGCLSAIELMFQARFHLYRWMIYHHDVVRRNLAIQRALDHLLDEAKMKGLPVRVVTLSEELMKRAGNIDGYFKFVDGCLQSYLYSVFDELKCHSSETANDIILFLNVVLFRKKDCLLSLWKRADQYYEFCNSVFNGSSSTPIVDFNRLLNDRYQKDFVHYGKKGRLKFAKHIEEVVNSALAPGKYFGLRGRRIFAYSFADFAAGPKDLLVWAGNVGIPANEISPSLASLTTAWLNSPQFMLYCEHPQGENPKDATIRARKDVSQIIKKALEQ